jgi:aryl-alcohol dehydrogenase-like predicted oxidoreductase
MIKAERDALFIATKVGFEGGAGRANILAQFDQSRRQRGEDTVDLLYMHRFDDNTPLEETFETLAELQQSGAIRYIGVSNYAAWQVMKAQAVAHKLGTKIDAIQPMYNLVKRQAEVEIFPMAVDQGITIFPYSPLGGGLLTGKYAKGVLGRLAEDDRYNARYAQGWMHDCAAQLAELAAVVGQDPATLAVAWAARHPAQPHPIISARSLEQLAPSLAALDFVMDDTLAERITALSITPAPATDRLEEA